MPDIKAEIYKILMQEAERADKMHKKLAKELMERTKENGEVIGDSKVLGEMIVYKGLAQHLCSCAAKYQ